MKIDEISNLIPSQEAGSVSKNNRKIGGESTFQKILNAAKNSQFEGKISSSKLSVNGALPVNSQILLPVVQPLSPREATIKIEHMLDDLEKYGEVLGNCQLPSENLGEAISEVSSRAGELSMMMDQFPDSSPLKKLTSDIVSLTAKEMAKFRRGDYNV